MRRPFLLALALTAALAGCGREEHPTGAGHAGLSAGKGIPQMPTGDLAGGAASTVGQVFANPFEGDPGAIQEGRRLFVAMNCAGCHGYQLKGGMGPDLTDTYWRYGGSPAAIYQTIYQGRPKGMPAWGAALPPSEIWKLVAYIESYGGTVPPQAYQAGLQGDIAPGGAGGGGANQQKAGIGANSHSPGAGGTP